MNQRQKAIINHCVEDLESIWDKINKEEPMDAYDRTKLSKVIGVLRKLH